MIYIYDGIIGIKIGQYSFDVGFSLLGLLRQHPGFLSLYFEGNGRRYFWCPFAPKDEMSPIYRYDK